MEYKSRTNLLQACKELQKTEIETLQHIYMIEGELEVHNGDNQNKETVIILNLSKGDICSYSTTITFELPKDYPLESFLVVHVKVNNCSDEINHYVNEQIYKYIQRGLFKDGILNIVYKVNEVLENFDKIKTSCLENKMDESSEDSDAEEHDIKGHNIKEQISFMIPSENLQVSKEVLARRVCYSHHIRSPIKRSLIIKWARELEIGGYSKIGYPGVIICEGRKEEVDLYVNSLNKLRWKHFDCRGMEDIPLESNETLDSKRVLPKLMYEIGPNGMASLSDICSQCGLRELFLTSMKIYKPREKEEKKSKKESSSKKIFKKK